MTLPSKQRLEEMLEPISFLAVKVRTHLYTHFLNRKSKSITKNHQGLRKGAKTLNLMEGSWETRFCMARSEPPQDIVCGGLE
ncbi:hypothetical protein BX600DRAFT_474768, partial [Xylariales sp. PMI_506]